MRQREDIHRKTCLVPRTVLWTLALTAWFHVPAGAQLTLMERTPDHRRLDFLVGEWTHRETQKILGEERVVRSNARHAWLPGGVWLRGEATIWGLPGLAEHRGWFHMTYDEAADEYVQLWYDNQSALLFIHRGGFSDESTLVLEGSHEWGGKTVHSRNIYRILSDSEYSREYLASNDGGESFVRRSLARFRRQGGEGKINEAFADLEWLIGNWVAEFRPLGEDRLEPTMSFRWSDGLRSSLYMTGTQPTADGRLVPEYESTVVMHPVRQKLVFLGTYRLGEVVEDGDVELLEDGGVRLNMRVHYPAGSSLPFGAGQAGAEGHTLEFRRTFYRQGEEGLRGFFVMKRGEDWVNPHPELGMDEGYPWRRSN